MPRYRFLLAAFVLLMIGQVLRGPGDDSHEAMPYSGFLRALEAGTIATVEITGDQLSGLTIDGETYTTTRPWDPGLMDRIAQTDTEVRVLSNSNPASIGSTLLSLAPLIIFLAVVFMVMRMMGSTMARQMGMGKSRAKLISKDVSGITFEDVAGIDEARAELAEIVDFLRNPDRYWSLGGRIPKGVLLAGGPGVGKTLLAKAVAGESGVPFYSVAGSDFVEMFVGVGASRARSMFEEARKNAPCILFIDEIDAVGRKRAGGFGPGNEEREQTLNQILVEMDGFGDRSGVIVIAATNRPDVLDPALLRPGRFDRQITVPTPDLQGRIKILAVHARKVALAAGADLAAIARGTPGFSGADLENLVNEAALAAARRRATSVDLADFEAAKDRILMGNERRSTAPNAGDLRITACHEAGHALVAVLTPGCDPVHKATIVPRGQALGMVVSLPERDQPTQRMDALKARIAMIMGGRAAEEIVFGPERVTSGAASDIEHATRIARAMVSRFGMSDRLGLVAYETNHDTMPPGSATEALIMAETRTLVEEGMARARAVLTEHRETLDRLTAALLARETLDGDAVRAVINGAAHDELPPLGAPDATELPEARAGAAQPPRIRIGGTVPGLL